MRKYLFYLTYLFVILTWSCKGDNENIIPLKAIQVTPDNLQLVVGVSRQIKAGPDPSDADPQEMPFQWESNNTKVATVTPSGMVRAISVGSAKITVSACISSGISKKIPVTVVDNSIPLTKITVTPETLALEVGQATQVTAKAEPANATGVSFVWKSDDTSIATVSATGLVTGKARGTTTITVKSGDIEKKISVTVTQTLRIVIGNATYSVDTLNYEELAQGIKWLKFKIPEFVNGFGTLGKGLVVNAVEVDLTYSENKIEVWPASQATVGNRERPSVAYKRKEQEYAVSGRKPVSAINGDFYLLAANNNTGYAYINSRPLGMEVSNGMVVQTPFGNNYRAAFIIRDNGLPEYANTVSFSGKVNAGDDTFTLAEVNGFANAGELVLFNNLSNSYPTDSAFAWSPYTSTMVSLSFPQSGWRVNDRMEFTVTGIDYDVETTIPAQRPYKGKDFNGQGAILVGNSTSSSTDNGSKLFLSKLKEGDKVGITMEVNINGNKVADKKLNVIGFRHVMLGDGLVTNTWNEAHPRTAIGYSQDRKKAYLMVIDGRQNNYSAGATTGQVGAILKALGAHTGVNLDGGGSSAMVVNGTVRNKPSDGSERAVANGIIVVTKK